MNHLIITGTGRTGTTFLVQLMTELGLDTGFTSSNAVIYPECDAGMEHDLSAPDAPYIVKSPHLCVSLDQVLRDNPKIVVDHAIVPIRSLYEAAESRRDVARRNPDKLPYAVPGGLWGTTDPNEQEQALTLLFYKLVHTLVVHQIPTTFVEFPRIVRDPDYLCAQLCPVLRITPESMLDAWAKASRPELIHNF